MLQYIMIVMLSLAMLTGCGNGGDGNSAPSGEVDNNNSNGGDSNVATSDEDDNSSTTPDTTKPVITLNGDNPIVLTVGTAYVEPGATATDDRDGVINVTISGNVDTNRVGSYTITYRAKDKAGNEATVTRTVIVEEEEDTTSNVVKPTPGTQKNNFKIILKTTEKIAGYEVHLKFTNDTATQSNLSIDNSFLGATGRTVNDLGADINTTTKEIQFGGFSFGNQEGVTGEFDIFTFKSSDSLSQISIIKKSCVDKDANDIACDVEIRDN